MKEESEPAPAGKKALRRIGCFFGLLVYYLIGAFLLECSFQLGRFVSVFFQLLIIASTFAVIKRLYKRLCLGERSNVFSNSLGALVVILILLEEFGYYREISMMNERHMSEGTSGYNFKDIWFSRYHLPFVTFAIVTAINLFMIKTSTPKPTDNSPT
jgi:hypothetical protein